MIFQDRGEAGDKLAQKLQMLTLKNPFVLALPRGGVAVGSSVARILACPLDIIPLMKISIPWSPEASYGVVTVDGTTALNRPLINRLELSDRELEMAAAVVLQEAKRREQLYRQGRSFPDLSEKSVVLIDDGLASGYSMLAAVNFTKKRQPLSIIVASPIASDMAHRLLAAEKGIDRIVVLAIDAEPLLSLSSHYKEFRALTDEDVMRALASS